MNSMFIWRPGMINYGCQHYTGDLLTSKAAILDQIAMDASDSLVPLQQLKTHKVVIDFIGEGQCDKSAHLLIAQCQELFQDVLVIFTAAIDVSRLPYRAISLPALMIDHCSWYDKIKTVDISYEVEEKFLCLMRRPSRSRAIIARNLLPGTSVRLSFGCMTDQEVWGDYRDILPDTQLPILIDGITERITWKEHDQRSRLFHTCAFNIVVESGSQMDPTWQSLFISEKTFKAFALKQIPIWFAVPGLVQQVRHLGFDLFDDIIDHSYDSISDEHTRFNSLFQQIRELDARYDLAASQDLRLSLAVRLENNRRLLDTLLSSVNTQLRQTLQEFETNA